MKRKIEDYENKLVAIFCSSIEEWDKINDLLGKKGLTRDYGDISDPDNVFVDCIHINGKGTASKKYYEQKSYIIYSASDFLEKESKFEAGKWYYVELGVHKHYLKFNKVDKYKAFLDVKGFIEDLKRWSHGISIDIENVTFYRLLTDLSEIQEFLPDNHPDKIVKLTSFPLEGCVYDESGLLIKKEEAMFKKNDYIVVLYNDNSLNSWTNQCFKQLEDLYYLKVVKNLNGNTDGWSVINFKNQSKWRYASSAEILEYERIGKPFDVTTLIKKEKSLVKQVQEGLKLKGRWLKCIKQCDWNTINVGEYIQILENNSLVPYVEWKDNKENYCIDLGRIDKAEFELMPEGFSPNEKEWIPKVGDWVFGKNLGTSDYNKCKHPVKIIEIKEDRFKYDLLSNPKTNYPRNKSCFYYLSTIVRKATEQDIAMHLGDITHNQYPLTPIESFQLSIYDLKDIYIAPIIKKETKIQTITIESTTDLNLNLKTIKSKQIQTIKI